MAVAVIVLSQRAARLGAVSRPSRAFVARVLAGPFAAALLSWTGNALATDITGAGATFPYPIYAKWAAAYKEATGTGVNYQSIGSGAGIAQIKAGTIDFGASDKPLEAADLAGAGLLQFPAIIGGVVPVMNLEGIAPGQLVLSGAVLADIYLGRIRRWNDKAIAELNPGAPLPATGITVVRRSDGSGTSFLWTDYLAKASPAWKREVGAGAAVAWPEGVGGKGNEGVAAYVQRIKGSIGYVEFAYAKRNRMRHVALLDREGGIVQPGDAAFRAAAANANWSGTPGFGVVLTDQPGSGSWPVTGASFILMHTKQERPERGAEVTRFFDWAFRNGQAMAAELGYVALPPSLVVEIAGLWKREVGGRAGNPSRNGG